MLLGFFFFFLSLPLRNNFITAEQGETTNRGWWETRVREKGSSCPEADLPL